MTANRITDQLLAEIGIDNVPSNPLDWPHTLQLTFGGTGEPEQLLEKARADIFRQLPAKKKSERLMGLYAIYTESGECLYIGKSKNFYSRFFIHYKTSIGIEKVKKYREFFQDRHGVKTFKWIQIQFPLEDSDDRELEDVKLDNYKGETLRIALERLVTCHMLANTSPKQPTFEHEHASIK